MAWHLFSFRNFERSMSILLFITSRVFFILSQFFSGIVWIPRVFDALWVHCTGFGRSLIGGEQLSQIVQHFWKVVSHVVLLSYGLNRIFWVLYPVLRRVCAVIVPHDLLSAS